jgi:hypothetical protein
VAPGWQIVLRLATICTPTTRILTALLTLPIYRSKFNTALGIEGQGFCVIK